MLSNFRLSRPCVSFCYDLVFLKLVNLDYLLEFSVFDEEDLGAGLSALVYDLVLIKDLVLPKQVVLGQKLFILVLKLDAALDLLNLVVYNSLLDECHRHLEAALCQDPEVAVC